MKQLYLFLIAASLLSSCATATATPTPTLPSLADTPNPLPEPTDPTQLITVRAGETFDLVLTSNPSTGYRWQLVEELDPNVVELVDQVYIAQEPSAIGSGGVDAWTMRAINSGDATIMLGYYPLDNDNEPAETIIFSIEVE
ncbi:MAG TPA: protease inhibitor I42 family protein [Anaerolineales bacterium]|nr:protease inhibitor I42 family protein [Anaerolineales bacterium]